MRKQNDLYFDKLNVGGTLEALVHSYVHEIPLIIDRPILPFELANCPNNWDVTRFGYEKNSIVPKLQLWDRLTFLLSVSGMVLFPNNIQNMRASDKKIIIITTNNSYYSVYYKKVKLFEMQKTDKVEMYDWFTVRSGCLHSHELIQGDSDFVSQVLFYPSKRPSVSKEYKDVVAISHIKKEDQHNPDYSEGMARLKVLRIMREAGIQGTKNGYNKYGKPSHTSINIEHTEREFKLHHTPDNSIEKLLSKPPNKKSDLWKLTQKLLFQQRISTLRELSR